MAINGVDAVTLGVEDVDAARRFYRDFGLAEVEHGSTQALFNAVDNTEIAIRDLNAAGLPDPVTGGSTVREIVWGVATSADLERIAAELSKDRPVSTGADGIVRSIDDDGFGIAFRVTRREPRPAPNRANIYGAEPNRPINSRVDFLQAVRPQAIAHVVLVTPDVARAARFYVERLQFRISDLFRENRGAFLRPAGSPYHHNLFLIQGPQRGLHHIAFGVTDFNDVILGGKKLLGEGWETKMGPGRHVIGSNYFWYFNSPCGGAMELTADMDYADDDWEVREWDFVPQNTAAWSTIFNAPTDPR